MPGVTEQEIAQAKQMNLYQYMQLCEPDNFKPEGPGQFRHKGHSSLTFAEDGSWTYFKTKATGRTALNYLIAVEGVSFVEAVQEINRIQGGVRPSFQPVKTPPPPAEKKPAKEFRLPRPDKNNYAATAYLRKRCIHPNVLTVCKQKRILYQTSFKDHPNCVFVGRDGNGEPKGGSLRGCSKIQFRRDSLTGQRSNNLQHGVTWNYANGIYNDTAEIISLAAVYYQQDWPRSELLSAFSDNVPFTKFCRALAAYGLDVTARESAPYSCMSYGGCVNGYRSEGEMVSIKDYRLETHTCSEGDDACGQYDAAAEWHWNEGHAENRSYSIWKEDGTHDVTVFFPIIFPDGATGSALSDLPEEYNAVADGKIKAADCTGNIVLDESANLYKGELNDWFYTPDELTVTFTVVTGEGDDAVSDDYEVAFTNATAIPWCPGELNDGQYGHYDLSCTIYLTGYDRYTDPETQAPNGADGGTGNLEALAESCDAGTLTRTIIKQDQYGNEYAGNAVSARYTKTITLPNGASGFQGWYKDGEDTYGNVEWASLLYRMDWEELYGIVDGIKCRATGSGMTEEELRQLFASLNIDATTARGQVVAFALSCQGKFVYAQPSSLRGGPGSPSVGINLDCSSFVQYCYWAQNLPFSAGSTAAYRNAADLVSISPSEVQPGDLRVVYASGGEQGHVQMALGGGAWIECCYGYGVAVNMSNAWMESRPCYYFRYAGF